MNKQYVRFFKEGISNSLKDLNWERSKFDEMQMEKDTIGYAWRNDYMLIKEQEIMVFLFDEAGLFIVLINDPRGKDQIFKFKTFVLAKKFLMTNFKKLKF